MTQGKREAELGIPVSPICNEATTDVPKSQIGFIGFICQPLFAALEQADPSGSVVTVRLSFYTAVTHALRPSYQNIE